MAATEEEDIVFGKSYFNNDPILKYCVEHSSNLHPAQYKLIEASLAHPQRYMLGAIEVIQLCTCLIKQAKYKNILDLGTFTGLSALSWALAIPDDGRVVTMDISDEDYNKLGKRFVEEAGVAKKIQLRIQPALKTLDDLIAAGESGKFDFAFFDADKTEYPQYYEKCMQLLRPGGLIAVDNALWFGDVTRPIADGDSNTKAINQLNQIIKGDPRVNHVLLQTGDGIHLAFKK